MARQKNNSEHRGEFDRESSEIYTEQGITETLKSNYMPYAMSVIVSRAIPEIDGLKPSQRKPDGNEKYESKVQADALYGAISKELEKLD